MDTGTMADHASSEAAVRGWFARYMRVFEAVACSPEPDIALLQRFYAVPLMMVNGSQHMVLSDPSAVVGHMSLVLAELRRAGYRRTITHELRAQLLTAQTALVAGRFSRLGEDGAEILRFDATELLIGSGESWRIAAIIAGPARDDRGPGQHGGPPSTPGS